MLAIAISSDGALEQREVQLPRCGPGQVLVRVRATGVNRADLLQVAGKYAVPPGVPADIPGLEFAGEIVEAGDDVSGWTRGDRVMGIVGGGAYAEYVVVHHGAVVAIPDTLDYVAAAAFPEAFITAHDALITQAALRPGESVLIHAVGSGVGLAAVQVAAWRGAVPFGTTRTAGKLEAARQLGMRDGVTVEGDPSAIAAAVKQWCDGKGVDVVLDLVGGAYVPAGLEALAMHGRLILVGTIAGNRADVRLDRILRKRLTIRGTVLRARSDAEKAEATRVFAADLLGPIAEGRLVAPVHAVLPLAEAAEAHRIVAADANTGKVVLAVS
jgi:NADPH2:quinone reductase